MTLNATSSSEDIAAAGYDVYPTRYVDAKYDIDWAVINWTCFVCGDFRWAPGPGEPPMDEHGAFTPVLPGVNVVSYKDAT